MAIDREELFGDPDPNVIWRKLISHYAKIIEKHCPLKDLKVAQERPGYLTYEILGLMKDRDAAYKAARKEKTEALWTQAKALRSEVQRQLLRAKRDLIQINQANGDNPNH